LRRGGFRYIAKKRKPGDWPGLKYRTENLRGRVGLRRTSHSSIHGAIRLPPKSGMLADVVPWTLPPRQSRAQKTLLLQQKRKPGKRSGFDAARCGERARGEVGRTKLPPADPGCKSVPTQNGYAGRRLRFKSGQRGGRRFRHVAAMGVWSAARSSGMAAQPFSPRRRGEGGAKRRMRGALRPRDRLDQALCARRSGISSGTFSPPAPEEGLNGMST
jgi:hypothetical protein